ncbi:MAG: hypothetical protein K0U37_01470, partial [Gammaproteobacteria bacterium]|nr:hypothetical protein [Gammaproteobacteria bacterium]
NAAELDFASVQRSNPEMERRAQEVINTCWAMGDKSPIVSILDEVTIARGEWHLVCVWHGCDL